MAKNVQRKERFDSELRKAVVKVGYGRGFIIHDRAEMPPFQGRPMFRDRRLVVTAAHCLPKLPPCHAANFPHEKTYESLLGTLDAPEPAVWAECLFADPIADIALLGSPDPEAMDKYGEPYDEPIDEYYELADEAPALRIGTAPQQGRAWLLALDGQWVPLAVELSGNGLWIEGNPKNEPGVSGSPLLAEDGSAVALVCMGTSSGRSTADRKPERSGPHPVLAHHLPGWLAKGLEASPKTA